MSAKIIDGRALAASTRAQLTARVARLAERHGGRPGLAVVLVGHDPASAIYVRNKLRACQAVGIESFSHHLPTAVTNEELVALIECLNGDPAVHGILVQLPLPAHIDLPRVLGAISAEKDADGFHLYNVGALVSGRTTFSPCTPFGVMRILQSEDIVVDGSNAVVVGASNIVGKPMALMLLAAGATVSICHARTRDLAQFTILADILVVAAGVPNLILPPMVRSGAVVIDVGINRLPDGSIAGDVDFEGVSRRASYITPVPGGVGPMTVTMLLENTIASMERATQDAAVRTLVAAG